MRPGKLEARYAGIRGYARNETTFRDTICRKRGEFYEIYPLVKPLLRPICNILFSKSFSLVPRET